MTNEITKVELTNSTGFPRRFTCASGTGIAKGTICALSDPRTAAAATTARCPVAGITSMQKDGTDYSTSVTLYTNFIGEFVASGAITAGSAVCSASDTNYPNTVMTCVGLTNPASGAEIIGYALETASDAETINVRVEL